MASSSTPILPSHPVADTDRQRKVQLSVLKVDPKQLASEVEKISSKLVSALIKSSVEVDVQAYNISIFSIFEFQGFDPYAILRKLIFFRDHYKLSEGDLLTDIMYMIAANIYMGNLSGKALARRSQTGRDVVDELVTRYQIQPGTTGTGLASDQITFPRVAGSFPVLTCKLAERLPTKDMIGKPFKSLKVPKFMRVNAFATFCPPQMAMRTRLFFLKACAAYSCDQSITFLEGQNKKQKDKNRMVSVEPTQIAGNQWTFIWAASEGSMPPLANRSELHIALNTAACYDDLVPIVANYNKIMSDPTAVPTKVEFEQDLTNFVTGKYIDPLSGLPTSEMTD